MKILVVEDEKMISDAVCKILEDADFYTDAIYDGEDALYYIETAKYDLIILDIMLPAIDGTEILKRVRAAGNSTPILMLTAKNTIPDKVFGLNSGADDYMTKPFDADELLARVGALTRRTGNVIIGKLDFGDLSLDLNTAMLFCGESSIQLTKKEFRVLKMLFANSNMTLTKENLIVNIWGEDSDTTENNVEAYISFIRKKIRYLGSGVSIKNIQGIGYRPEFTKDNKK